MSARRLANSVELEIGELKRLEVDGNAICLARVDEDAFYAIEDTCSHEGSSLSGGELIGLEVECPIHSSRFDLRTGAVRYPPATRPLRVYRVVVQHNGDIYVEM